MDSNSLCRIPALVLAAGLSSRMGALKPLLPLGNKTVLETVIDRFLEAGVQDVYVVIGHRQDELRNVLEGKRQVHCVCNPEFRRGMFSSVRAGVQAMPHTAFFMTPADIPLFTCSTVQTLIKAYRQTQTVVCPVYRGQQGHPIVIPPSLREEILTREPEGGLRELLREQPCFTVPVQDAGILYDMDTPEAYKAIQERFIGRTGGAACDK